VSTACGRSRRRFARRSGVALAGIDRQARSRAAERRSCVRHRGWTGSVHDREAPPVCNLPRFPTMFHVEDIRLFN
jgi:hypothetical protein